MSTPDHLITPLDWSAEALRHAAEWTGQPEGARALVESRRYLAMHELIERLRADLERAREALEASRVALSVAIEGLPALHVDGSREDICAARTYLAAIDGIDAALAAKGE